MKKLLFLLSTTAFAEMPQHWVNPDKPDTLYLDEKACPGPCYPMVKNGVFIGDIDTLIVKEVTSNVCTNIFDKPIKEKVCHDEPVKDGKDGEVTSVCADTVIGYEQKCEIQTNKEFVVDDSKKAAKDAVIAAQKAATVAEVAAKEGRLAKLKALGEKATALTAAEIQDLLKTIAVEVYKGKK